MSRRIGNFKITKIIPDGYTHTINGNIANSSDIVRAGDEIEIVNVAAEPPVSVTKIIMKCEAL